MDTKAPAAEENTAEKNVTPSMTAEEARAVARDLWGKTSVEVAKYLAAQSSASANVNDLKDAISQKAQAVQFTIAAMRRAELITVERESGKPRVRPYYLTRRGREFAELCTKLGL